MNLGLHSSVARRLSFIDFQCRPLSRQATFVSVRAPTSLSRYPCLCLLHRRLLLLLLLLLFQGESTQPDQDLAEAAFMRPTVASQAAGAASPKFKTARELEKEALRNERAEREELNSEARLQWEKRRVKMAAQN